MVDSLEFAGEKKAAGLSAANRRNAGLVNSGPYQGQRYEVIAARRGWPRWFRVILKDASGVAERDLREEYLLKGNL